jgi:phage terminase small subunit
MTRKAKPTALKVLEGNRGKRKLPKNEPKPYPKVPDMPEGLDERAQETYKTLAPKLEKLGLLTEVTVENSGLS